MDRGLSPRSARLARESLVHVLGEERHHRREQPHERRERLVKRLISGKRVTLRAGLPEARAVASEVPRREVVPERLHLRERASHVICLERGTRIGNEMREGRQQPAIHELALAHRHRSHRRIEAVVVRIGDEERIRIPKDQQPSFQLLKRGPREVDRLLEVLAGDDPADRIRPDELARLDEVDHVAARLVELFAGSGEHRLERLARVVRSASGQHHDKQSCGARKCLGQIRLDRRLTRELRIGARA